jgi:trk system potassium uptake protein
VVLSAITTIRGRKNPELFRMTIQPELMNKAFSIFLFAVTFISLGTILLAITAPQVPFEKLLFEQISAFCTVGVSTGITADLGPASRVVLISSMFIGRVGSLTLFFALSKQAKSSDYKYPKAVMMVG